MSDKTAPRLSSRQAEQIEVSVVMPCLNEAEGIGQCVLQARDAIERASLNGEVVVADNGSEDNSAEIAAGAGARVVHQPARGYGNAYIKGLTEARGKYIVMGDSDGTYDFSLIPQLLEPLRQGYDMVMGSRIKGHIEPGAMPWTHRHIGVPLLTFVLNLITGSRVSDAHTGLRAFTREALEKMDLNTGGMEFASEMILKAAREKLKIAEVPIHYLPRKGKSKLRTFRDAWRHLRFMLLYSPTLLFVVPGLVFLFLGLVMLISLIHGPLIVAGWLFDIHYMVLGSLLAMLGYQVLGLGLYARTYALAQGFVKEDRFLESLKGIVTLERGLIVGFLVFAVGLGWLVWILVAWVQNMAGFTGYTYLRPALLGMTLMVVGAQTMFSASFLSLLVMPQRRSTNGR